MQTTTNNNDEPRGINQGDGRHQKTTKTEGPGTEDGAGEFFVVFDDQALFFTEELLGRQGEGGREGGRER